MTTPTQTLPALFVGHGTPMNALESNRWTRAWAAEGERLRRNHEIRAILAVSAHWYINATAVTAMPMPSTIHDFYGFPQQLFNVEYPVAGLPDLADEVAELAKPTWVGRDTDSWGIDHGTWSVMVHMFPKADIPVVQLSIDASKPGQYHHDLGATLAPLRDQGVLVVTSGNVVHNLGRVEWGAGETGTDWNHEFDEHATELLAERPGDVASLAEHRHYRLAAPTPDHLLPLYCLAGLASAADAGAETFVEGYHLGSLSMTGYRLN